LCAADTSLSRPWRILHIAPLNTAGVPCTFLKAERALGHESRLITLTKHPFHFDEDICLNLPFITTPGVQTLKKLLRFMSISTNNDITHIPPERKYNAFEKHLFRLRDKVWDKKITDFLSTFDITSFDLYQLDGGSGLYHDSRVIKQLSKQGKTIICTYLGSDLRIRGVIPEINEISSYNFTVEYDHIDLYPGIHHIPFPFDFTKFHFSAEVEKTPVIIGHAPSKRSNKGSNYILKILQELQKFFSFEIRLIENQPHQEALTLKSQCSLFIDQISDLGYGINAVESMAMGIPTFSSLIRRFKKIHLNAPIIEVTFDDLKEKLIPFIESSEMRLSIGKASREWVRQVHDAANVIRTIHGIVADY